MNRNSFNRIGPTEVGERKVHILKNGNQLIAKKVSENKFTLRLTHPTFDFLFFMSPEYLFSFKENKSLRAYPIPNWRGLLYGFALPSLIMLTMDGFSFEQFHPTTIPFLLGLNIVLQLLGWAGTYSKVMQLVRDKTA